MKHIIFFVLALTMSVLTFAQKQVIEFSDFESTTYTKPIKMGNVTFYASPKKFIEVDDKVESAFKGKFSKRLKLKAKGSVIGCIVIVDVKKGTKVTMVAANANKTSGERTMSVTSTTTTDVIVPDFIVSDGKTLCTATYEHQGKDGKVVFISSDGCFNIYRIEVED